MQGASHQTRAYFKNAKGLQGFLILYSVDELLKESRQNKKLAEACKHRTIILNNLLEELRGKNNK